MKLKNISRRELLRSGSSAGVFVLGATLLGCESSLSPNDTDASDQELLLGDDVNQVDTDHQQPLNIFVSLSKNGLIEIRSQRAEMGQQIRTGIARIIADEMEADWKHIRVVQAEGDDKYGDQATGGSKSIRRDFVRLRKIGASARFMLEKAASEIWNVPQSECKAVFHQVIHGQTGRKLDYGTLAELAATYEPPAYEKDGAEGTLLQQYRLKNRDEWRYIGKAEASIDMQDMIRGKNIYGQDISLPGMKYAVLARAPVHKGTLVSFDASDALKVPGVLQVLELPAAVQMGYFKHLNAVAVVADTTWAAIQGRKALKIEWADNEFNDYDSATYRTEIEAKIRTPQKVIREKGDVDTAIEQAEQTLAAEYYIPHFSHTPMEPPAGLASWNDGKIEAWTSTQAPNNARKDIALVTGLDYKDVRVNNLFLGGSFGRKSMADFVYEAALLTKELKIPVKVVWTREDDIQHDYYHSVNGQRIEAALDKDGGLQAWHHRSVFPPIGSIRDPENVYGSAGELGMGFSDNPFNTPNMRLENGSMEAKVRIGWYRGVHNINHVFATHSFVAELAHTLGRDPKDYLLDLIGPDRHIDLQAEGIKIDYNNHSQSIEDFPIDTARLKHVLNLAAEKAGWQSDLPEGRGMGIAAHRNFLSYAAVAVEVEIIDGEIVIPQVQVVCDCGLAVNPESVKAQLEGGALFGLSTALASEITMSNGKVNQSNFHDYQVLRSNQSPQVIEVTLVEHENQPPAGIGEASTAVLIPALVNAIFAATGKRIRSLPIGNQLRA